MSQTNRHRWKWKFWESKTMSQTNRRRWRWKFWESFVKQEQLSNAIEKMMKELRDERRYETGLYYRSLRGIWGHESVEFDGAAKEWKQYRSSDKLALRYYRESNEGANDEFHYFADKFPVHPLFPRAYEPIAHLIPNDPSCSLAWLRALSIVTGIDVSEDVDSPLLDEKLRSFVEGDGEALLEPGDVNENKNVPLKGWNWNFLMLPEDYEKHFDTIARNNEEQLILSPIWNPEEEWSPGTGYKLMVAASPESYKWLLGTDIESVQYEWIGNASPGEQEKATKFLALTVKALADLLVEHGGDDLKRLVHEHEEKKRKQSDNEDGDTRLESVFKRIQGAIPHDLLSQRSYHTNESTSTSEKSNQPAYRKKAQAFVGNIKAIDKVCRINWVGNGRTNVQIPVFYKSSEIMKPILVIDLGKYFEGNYKHLIPDPFLVVLKAAVSWSSFRDQPLLPACGKRPDHQSESSDHQSESSDHQSGSVSDSSTEEELIPFEIFTTTAAGEDTASGDDDSLNSLSEALTGSPDDENLEEVSTVSPCDKTTVKSSVVMPSVPRDDVFDAV